MMTDPIADLLTRIRNANSRFKDSTEALYSKMKHQIVDILQRERYISRYYIVGIGINKKLRIYLKYQGKNRYLTGIQRVSKPGLRRHVSYQNIPWVLNGHGIAIISTSQGLITDKEARVNHIGGEWLASVW